MVKIAIAGGSGNVAVEVIDGLLATGKHEILILSRQTPPAEERRPNVEWFQTTYQDPKQLENCLSGVHTVLSFITAQADTDNTAQMNLIDASIGVGVKRFAPSEWGGSNFDHMPWYAGKTAIRQYLQEINKNGKILEYTLFQPSLFTNYFGWPHASPSSPHFHPFQMFIDFQACRALVRARSEGGFQDTLVLTTVADLVSVVVKAIEFEGEWPVIGGIKGSEVTIEELIGIGEKVRGRKFHIEELKTADLENGKVTASWLPKFDHPGMPNAREVGEQLTASLILAIAKGALRVGDEWNRTLGGWRGIEAEEFLRGVWEGKE